MNLVLTITAAVAALGAVGVWWWRSRIGAELATMLATETSGAGEVATKAAGSLVELKGPLRSNALLTAEFSAQPCIYYRALVEREVENVTTGSDGKRETRRQYDTVSSVEKHAPCRLEDATGSIAVDFEGAKVEAVQSHRRYEGAGLEGGVAVLVAGLLGATGRTLGHRYTEWAMPADVPVYLLGTVTEAGFVGADLLGKNPFIISHKSEEEREKSLGRTRLWLLVTAVVLVAAALAFLAGAIAVGA